MNLRLGTDAELALLASIGFFTLRPIVRSLALRPIACARALRPSAAHTGSRPRGDARTPAPRLLSLLGFALVITSTPAAGSRRAPVSPTRDARRAPEPPWSGTSEFSPPRSLVRAGHPALHGHRRALGERLFPRAGAGPLRPAADALLIYPPRPRVARASGGEIRGGEARSWAPPRAFASTPTCGRAWKVRAGDTLWDLAAAALGTDDPRRIARFWPAIHRKNRAVIGPNPNLIHPGQILELPLECEE